mgnify:FL=1
MKVVIVGGVAGGASAAARIRRLDEQAEIIVLERGRHVSFSNCSLPYYLGGAVENSDLLVMMGPDDFKYRHNIEVRTQSEVTKICRDRKEVVVRDLNRGTEYTESYDRLVLATGASPVVPKSIQGVDAGHVFTIRSVTDVCGAKDYIDSSGAQNIVVAGAGFVGVEVAENLRSAGKNVSIVEGADQVMAPFDYDMAQYLHKELTDKGIHLYLSSMVTAITAGAVTAVRNGKTVEIPADAVILSIGVAPETGLAVQAGLELGASRAIRVNHNYQTSDPDIYAVGDAVETFSRVGRAYGSFAQAGPAQRQARAAADHICGMYHNNKGYIATSCLRVFEQNAAVTGMNEKALKKAGIPYDAAFVLPFDKVSIMPDAHYMAFKLLFEVPTGRILGAQAIGRGDVVRRIDVIAALLTMNGTLDDLKEMELCYSQVYGTAKAVLHMAALVGLNILYGRVRQVRIEEVRGLVESGACIVDVREPEEFESGHLKNAVNVPLTQFRARMHEIPKDVPVYLHCRTGQRSYYALCELLGNGYRNVYNISGSFLGICSYEYYNDITDGREPIVTAYNFS